MTYEKPELFTLNLAGHAVRTADSNADNGSGGGKANVVHEAGVNDNGTNDNGGPGTSSTSGAYEADE